MQPAHFYLPFQMADLQETDPSCSICLDPLHPNTPISGHAISTTQSKVHHVFHTTCIEGWFQTNNTNCPLCQTPLHSLKHPLLKRSSLQKLLENFDQHPSSVLDLFLPSPIPEEIFSALSFRALHHQQLAFFHAYSHLIPPPIKEKICRESLWAGCFAITKILLKDPSLEKYNNNLIQCEVIENNTPVSIGGGDFSDEFLILLLHRAACKENIGLFQDLLHKMPSRKQSAFLKIECLQAVEKENLSALRTLFRLPIANPFLLETFQAAAQHMHLQTALFLCQTKAFDTLPLAEFQEMLLIALHLKHPDILPFFINHPHFRKLNADTIEACVERAIPEVHAILLAALFRLPA